jgi:hypothetical protein
MGLMAVTSLWAAAMAYLMYTSSSLKLPYHARCILYIDFDAFPASFFPFFQGRIDCGATYCPFDKTYTSIC